MRRAHFALCVVLVACAGDDPLPAGPPHDTACQSDCVGDSPIAAITREEYAFAVGDVLGVSDAPIDSLPADGALDRFVSNASTPRGPDAAGAYETAANEIARTAGPMLAAVCDGGPCLETLVRERGARLFRRPLAADEVAEYRALFDLVRAENDLEAAWASLVSALLQSPTFLYRVELGTTPTTDGARALSDHELAGRLASFLWRSVPDAPLLDAAARSELHTDAGLSREVARMMDDPRFDRALIAFHEGWLETALVPHATGWSPELEADMREELARYVQSIVRSDAPTLAHLLTEPSAPLSSRLAMHYGVPAPSTE
jgi:hypothetical protein